MRVKKFFKEKFQITFWVRTGVIGRSITGTAVIGQYVTMYHNIKYV